MRLTIAAGATLWMLASALPAASLTPLAERAFEHYANSVEAKLSRQRAAPATPLSADLSSDVRVDPVNGGSWEVSGSLLHHWRAAAFVPRASAEDLLALLNDYNHFASYYAPEVVSSHALADDGPTATLAMRFRKRKLVTVVLDAEFEVRNGRTGAGAGYSFSRSTHIWQIDQAGTASEHRRAEGQDDGFLWRLNSYWTFQDGSGGLLMECEAVSLTRGVPTALGWLISPIVQKLPRESLEFTLKATKEALMAKAGKDTYAGHTN